MVGLALRILPLFVVAISLWRIIPAISTGANAMGNGPPSIADINSVSIANSITGELGAATTKPAPAIKGRKRLEGWDRSEASTGNKLEVISCGEDGRCGTSDDVIDMILPDGSRKRIDGAFDKPLSAPKTTAKSKSRTGKTTQAPAAQAP